MINRAIINFIVFSSMLFISVGFEEVKADFWSDNVAPIGKALEKGVHDAGKTVEKAAQDTGKTAEKAAQDTGKAVEKAAQDTGKAIEKAAQDIGSNTREAHEQIDGAVKAASVFVESQFKSVGGSLNEAEKRLREGKILDAFFHLSTDQITNSSSNAADAVSQSPLLNQVASAAASAYGGPTGAAAYASWLTYETTGDLEAAIRAGALAGASSYANKLSKDVSSVNMNPELKRNIAKFSVNAAAIAASGGTEKDVFAALKEQATSAVTAEVKAVGKRWLSEEILPRISDKAQLDSAPKSWEKLSIVDKATKVSDSVERFKEDVRNKIINKTKIDLNTIALTSS